ncbi:MAG: O-antigen ligase family protein [Candidatus Niyogibacteria bacterium]|nr:O-antigen ligase family protein [Candidatus Niyogibacteria bacterium]
MNQSYLKVLHYAVLAGVFVLPFMAFIVPSDMFFPYITGKNFFFRVVAEIIFALWLLLALADKKYRPEISPLLYAVTATIIVLILSTIFGANPYRSFWSNYERMEGLISHLHLFAYFLVLAGSLKSDDLRRWFLYALSVSGVLMALYGWLQFFGWAQISMQSGPRADGSFGNAAYMAVFMLFNVFLLAYIALSEKRVWLKWVFAAFIAIEVPVIFFTATRGAILGLVGGAVIFAVLFGLLGKTQNVRRIALGLVGILALLAAFFFATKGTDFAKQNYILSRFQDLSFKERTVESRFTIWKMSYEGFKERPILGWGIENYNQVFNKYYNPVMWKQEPWFDRSHNIVFDWLIAGGLAGLAAYLSIFGAAIYMLWRRVRELNWEPGMLAEASAITALFAAYFFNNLFVFDNLVSYYLFFSVLGFVHVSCTMPAAGKPERQISFSRELHESVYPFAAAGVVAVFVFALYFLNVKPYLTNKALLGTLQDMNQQGGKVDLIIADFEKVFAYDTFGSGEAREQLSGYANNILRSNLPAADKEKVYGAATGEFEKQVAENPRDVRAYLVLASLYSDVGRNNEAFTAINKALELSPKKQQIYFMLADIHMRTGDGIAAVKAMQAAYDFDPTYTDAAVGLAVTEIVAGRVAEAEAVLEKTFGTTIVADQKLINAYARAGNYARVRDIWLKFIEQSPENSQYHINLAATYLKLGERDHSVAELNAAIALNPQFKQRGEYYIGEIKAGRNP